MKVFEFAYKHSSKINCFADVSHIGRYVYNRRAVLQSQDLCRVRTSHHAIIVQPQKVINNLPCIVSVSKHRLRYCLCITACIGAGPHLH